MPLLSQGSRVASVAQRQRRGRAGRVRRVERLVGLFAPGLRKGSVVHARGGVRRAECLAGLFTPGLVSAETSDLSQIALAIASIATGYSQSGCGLPGGCAQLA